MTESLDPNTLFDELRTTSPIPIDAGLSFDELGAEMAFSSGGRLEAYGTGESLWDKVKREFRCLLCEKERKYEDVRKQFNHLSKEGSSVLVAAISAAIAVHIGIAAAAVIAPMVVLLLLATARVGKEAICTDKPLDEPVVQKLKPGEK